MSTAFGVLFGAIAVLAMSPRPDPDVAHSATVLSAVSIDEPATTGAAASAAQVAAGSATAAPSAPVGTVMPPVTAVLAKEPTAAAAKACKEQTWPYLDGTCLNNNTTRKRQPARVLKPETPAQSASAQVVPAPEITAAAKSPEPSKASKKREKTAKARQRARERDREFADRERGRYVDPRSAYASPYVYETPRRGWSW